MNRFNFNITKTIKDISEEKSILWIFIGLGILILGGYFQYLGYHFNPLVAVILAEVLAVIGATVVDGAFDSGGFGRLYKGIKGNGDLRQYAHEGMRIVGEEENHNRAVVVYRYGLRIIQRLFCIATAFLVGGIVSVIGYLLHLGFCTNDQVYYFGLETKAPQSNNPHPKGIQGAIYSLFGSTINETSYRRWAWGGGLATILMIICLNLVNYLY